MSDAWKKYAEDVIAAINFESEYMTLGVTGIKGVGDSRQGFCPIHNDQNKPSFSFFTTNGRFKCFAGCGEGSFADFVTLRTGKEYKEVIKEYGIRYGIQSPESKKPPISDSIPPKYLENLLNARHQLTWLQEKRGLLVITVRELNIGWDGKDRYTIPVLDRYNRLVNIRLYKPNPGEKESKITSFHSGEHRYGEARLYGLPELLQSPIETPVIICEGEWDRILLRQNGFSAVTGTAGCNTWKKEWNNDFKGRHVYICYDNDDEGRKGALNVAIALWGTAKTIHFITLPDEVGEKGDVTDFFVTLSRSAQDFQDLMVNATEYTGPATTTIGQEIIKLESFKDIDNPIYDGKRVEVIITVCGESTISFHSIIEFSLDHCSRNANGKCFECLKNAPDGKFKIQMGDREFISTCMSSDLQVLAALRRRICKYGEKSIAINIDNTKKLTVKEFFAHQHVKRYVNYISQDIGVKDETELFERKVYYAIEEFNDSTIRNVKPKSYLAKGYVKTHPKTQEISLLADHLEEVEDEYEVFTSAKNLELLQSIYKPREYTEDLETNKQQLLERILPTLQDIAYNVIKVRKREDVVFAMLLCFCSVLKIPFNKETLRGWLNLIVVGDSGTAKSLIYNRIATYIGIGDITSAGTASRTGIIYGIKEHPQRGWQIKAGRIPANSRKIIAVDEIQKIPRDDIGTLQGAIDDGFITIDRISSNGFETMTRFIGLCNPIKDDVSMDSYRFGAQVLKGIFPAAFIRRLDFAVFTSQGDIKNFDEINAVNTAHAPEIAPDALRSLVFWAWTRKENEIIIDEAVTKLILQQASSMSERYGYCTDVPLVAPSDFRKNLVRLSVACAVIDMSTDPGFNTIIVRKEHVIFMSEFLDSIYLHESCMLDKYSELKKCESFVTPREFDEFKAQMKSMMDKEIASLTQRFILLFMTNTNAMRSDELTEQLGCGLEALKTRLRLLKRFGLIKSGKKGFYNMPKFNKFIKRLHEENPELWKGFYNQSIYSDEKEYDDTEEPPKKGGYREY